MKKTSWRKAAILLTPSVISILLLINVYATYSFVSELPLLLAWFGVPLVAFLFGVIYSFAESGGGNERDAKGGIIMAGSVLAFLVASLIVTLVFSDQAVVGKIKVLQHSEGIQ